MKLVISFCNTKGGTSKSALSSLIALSLFERGIRVGLLDTDVEQRTSSKWVRCAEPRIPVSVEKDARLIKAEVEKLKQPADVVIIDTPGSSSPASFTAALIADIAIVPLQPSETDVDALELALAAISVAHEATAGTKPETFIVLTRTAVRDVQARNLRRELEANLPYKITRTEMYDYVVFRSAMRKYLSQIGGKDARKAEANLNSLISEILCEKLSAIDGRSLRPSFDKASNE